MVLGIVPAQLKRSLKLCVLLPKTEVRRVERSNEEQHFGM